MFASSTTFLANLTGLPAGVVPVTTTQADECYYRDAHNDEITKKAEECMQKATGLPVGVQVVTLPFQEELGLPQP